MDEPLKKTSFLSASLWRPQNHVRAKGSCPKDGLRGLKGFRRGQRGFQSVGGVRFVSKRFSESLNGLRRGPRGPETESEYGSCPKDGPRGLKGLRRGPRGSQNIGGVRFVSIRFSLGFKGLLQDVFRGFKRLR